MASKKDENMGEKRDGENNNKDDDENNNDHNNKKSSSYHKNSSSSSSSSSSAIHQKFQDMMKNIPDLDGDLHLNPKP